MPATGPTTDNTAYAIICDACWDSCKVPEGDDPSSELLAKSTRRLNQIIQKAITDTAALWLWVDTAITLVAGQGQYVLGPVAAGGNVSNVLLKPAQIRDQYYLYSSANGNTKRPVTRIARIDYDLLSTAVQQGPITQIFVDPQQLVLKVNTWLVPDANEATGTLQLVLLTQMPNFISITDQMVFPAEWALFLHWTLAAQLAMGQPQAVINRCDAMAEKYQMDLSEWDSEQETSITLQPDQRIMQPSRFRR